MIKRLNWGIIGAGGISRRRILPSMLGSNHSVAVALMDTNEKSLNETGDENKVTALYTDYKALVADPQVEAVYIASPVCFHYEQARFVLEAGKHLLLEKPVALNYDESQRLLAISKKSRGKAAAAMVMRFHDGHKMLRAIVGSGQLGQIVSCRAQLTCWFPEIENNWRQQKAMSGGGSLMDMGIHCIDLLTFITGQEVVRIGGFSDNKTFDYEVEDSVSMLLALDRGANCYIDVNFNIPDDASQCFLEIYGTKGSAIASGTIGQDGGGSITLTLTGDDKGYVSHQARDSVVGKSLEFQTLNIYGEQIRSFAHSVSTNREVEVPLEEGVKAQQIIETAYTAASEGRFLSV